MYRPLTQSIVLRLPPPISTNALWRSVRGRNIKSERYREWEVKADIMVIEQKVGRIEGPYGLTIKLPRKCRVDIDNTAKCINDTAQRNGLVENDSKCMRLLIERGVEDETVCFFISTKE